MLMRALTVLSEIPCHVSENQKNREKGEKKRYTKLKIEIEINWESQQWNKYRVINMLQKVKQLLFPSSPLSSSLSLSVCLRKQKSRRRRAVSSSGSGYGGRTWANNGLCIAWPNLPLRAATSACVSASASASSKLSVQPFDSRFWDTQAQIWDTTLALHTYLSSCTRYPVTGWVSLSAICNGAPPIESFAPFWRI